MHQAHVLQLFSFFASAVIVKPWPYIAGIMVEGVSALAADAALVSAMQQTGSSCWHINKSDPETLKKHLTYLISHQALPSATVAEVQQWFTMTEANVTQASFIHCILSCNRARSLDSKHLVAVKQCLLCVIVMTEFLHGHSNQCPCLVKISMYLQATWAWGQIPAHCLL